MKLWEIVYPADRSLYKWKWVEKDYWVCNKNIFNQKLVPNLYDILNKMI